MDTTTVNYAIEKLNEAFQHIRPTAIELGSEYVGYVVMKATVSALITIIILIVASMILRKIFAWYDKISDPAVEIMLPAFATLFYMFPLGVTIAHIYRAIIANAYPLMYTIEQLTK